MAIAAMVVLAVPPEAGAYLVGPALSLDELVEEADLVAKVVAVSQRDSEDPWFKPVFGFWAVETRLRLVEAYKGGPDVEIAFRHYQKKDKPHPMFFMPQHYRLEPGGCYLLFAKATETPGVYRQLWRNHRSIDDQGLLRAADERRRPGLAVRDVVWLELAALLRSESPADAAYAIKRLNNLSQVGAFGVRDFDRREMLAKVAPLIHHVDEGVASRAVATLGSRNRLMSPAGRVSWLASYGPERQGGGEVDPPPPNLGAEVYWRELIDLADSDAPLEVRRMAVRALGGSGRDEVYHAALRWIDQTPYLRPQAVVLLADYADRVDPELIAGLLADGLDETRIAAAHAVALGRMGDHAGVVARLLADENHKVVTAAAECLLALPAQSSRPVLEAHADHPEWMPLFANALAQTDARPHVDRLIRVVNGRLRPTHWPGGRIPCGVSWELLLREVYHRRIAGEQLEQTLDALEKADYHDSSQPRDLYAFYVQRSWGGRAERFRERCRERVRFGMDYFFDKVDESPDHYLSRFQRE